MLNDFLFALWFFWPAGAANMTPIVVAKLPLLKNWDAPLDGHRMYRGKPVLGASKTWRGFMSAVIMAMIIFWLQTALTPHLGGFTTYLQAAHYDHFSLWLGFLLGAGALIGDAVESFFKRQVAVEPGKSWFPFDQLDYIIGACVFSLAVTRLPLRLYLWILVVWFVLHLAFSYLGYLSHFKKAPI